MSTYGKLYKFLQNLESGEAGLSSSLQKILGLLSKLDPIEGGRIEGMIKKYLESGEKKDLNIALLYLERKLSLSLKDEDLLESLSTDEIRQESPMDLIIVLDNLRSALNVGNMIRSSEAFLAKEIWLSGYTAGADHPKVSKAALGADKHLPIYNLDRQRLEACKTEGYTIYGFDTIREATALQEVAFATKAMFIFGNERFGISNALKEYVDEYLYIPMHAAKRSINVGNALAIGLYEYARQCGKL